MSQFQLIETKSNGKKDYYLEGYVSTIYPDFVNDIVDEKGQKELFKELIGKKITMDEDHEEWRDPETGKIYDGKKNKYPLAKVVDAKLDEIGTWVSAKLNPYHPEFESRILPQIKEGYLHSFSIAYNVPSNKWFSKVLNGIKYRVIQGLKIANIAITGNPINQTATFSVALKSFEKMEKEQTIQELKEEIKGLKSQLESLQSSDDGLKGTDYKKMYEDLKANYDKMKANGSDVSSMIDSVMKKVSKGEDLSDEEEKIHNIIVDASKKESKGAETKSKSEENSEENEESNTLKQLKSEIDSIKKENKELRDIVDSPQLKSIVNRESKEPNKEQPERISMMEVL